MIYPLISHIIQPQQIWYFQVSRIAAAITIQCHVCLICTCVCVCMCILISSTDIDQPVTSTPGAAIDRIQNLGKLNVILP